MAKNIGSWYMLMSKASRRSCSAGGMYTYNYRIFGPGL